MLCMQLRALVGHEASRLRPGPAAPGGGHAAARSCEAEASATLAAAVCVTAGLLEGCTVAVRAAAPAAQPGVLALARPALEQLVEALCQAAEAAGASLHAAPLLPSSCQPAAQQPDAAPPVSPLCAAVSYSWARLRSQAPLSAPRWAPAGVAERMALAAAGAGPPRWHPLLGCPALLLGGALGAGCLLAAVGAGAPRAAAWVLCMVLRCSSLPSDCAVKSPVRGVACAGSLAARRGASSATLQRYAGRRFRHAFRRPSPPPGLPPGGLDLDGLARGAAHEPLAADLQLLARACLQPAAPPPHAATGSAAGPLALGVLRGVACCAAQLHAAYAALSDGPPPLHAALAGLPPPLASALRARLDRLFVAAVSLLVGAWDALAGPPPVTSPPSGPVEPTAALAEDTGADKAALLAEAAVAALRSLADLAFAGVPLRVHEELVARLSAAVAAAPDAAAPRLLAALPPYAAAAVAEAQAGGAPAAHARLAFLLPLAASAAVAVRPASRCAAVEAVLPYVYLGLRRPDEAAAAAAQAVWAALLSGLCAGAEAGGHAVAQLALAADMLPFFAERLLQGPCGPQEVERAEAGLRQVGCCGSGETRFWFHFYESIPVVGACVLSAACFVPQGPAAPWLPL